MSLTYLRKATRCGWELVSRITLCSKTFSSWCLLCRRLIWMTHFHYIFLCLSRSLEMLIFPSSQSKISELKLRNLVIHNSNCLEGILEYLCRLFIPKAWNLMVNKSHYLASPIQRLKIYFIYLYQPLFTKRLMVFPWLSSKIFLQILSTPTL